MPVLIRGETGTGKELAARRIHEAGNRASGPFLDVNCAALAETLLESELFGHVKGAFSGANRDRKGKFCAASGGTLFLDEIGEMSLSCQVKILRVLQEKRVTPVGAESSMTCDARIVAATHHNLRALVEEGRFREDLFYRLCGMEILMPPLRERVEDIPLLCIHFLKEVAEEDQPRDPYQEPLSLSTEALDMLMNYDWPGNVRQLEQALMAAMAICESEEIRPEDFPTWLHTEMRATGHARVPQPPGPDPRVEAVPKGKSGFSPEERARYLKALESTKYPGTGRWNLSKAANQLGIPRKTFAYRLKRLGVIL
jgi:two-component system response regulator PilR (NtrC family)